jgi:hypothetical protein
MKTLAIRISYAAAASPQPRRGVLLRAWLHSPVKSRLCQGREGRKYFLFEKKKQKTFDCWLTHQERSTRTRMNKSFLVLFFKKELLPSFTRARDASGAIRTGRPSITAY